mgnify:CR=1 FL=1
MGIMSSLRRRAAAVAAAVCAGVLALTGCTAFNNSDDGTADGNGTSATTQTFQPSGGKPTATLSIASGSENKEVAVAIQKAADQSNVAVTMHYMGSLEIMNALKAGGQDHDAVWPASSMWISMGDTKHIVKDAASTSTTPIVFGIAKSKAVKLGWADDTGATKPVSTADILAAVSDGKLTFSMTSATVIDSALNVYQTALRKPSWTIWVVDYSGSMSGEGKNGVVKGLNAALDPDQAKKSYIEPASGDVNILIPFETEAHRPVKATGTSTSDLLHEADATDASGGTDIYEGLLSALDELPSESEASQYTTAIVLMTDGRSNSDHQDEFESAYKSRGRDLPIFSIMFDDADPSQLKSLATLSNAKVFDGRRRPRRRLPPSQGLQLMLQVICGFVVGLLLAGLGFGLVGGGVPGLIVAVVLAALGYIAASTLTEPERRIGKMLVSALPNGQKTADTIDAANARLNSIAMLTKQVRDPAVKAEANDFIAATKDLVQYVTRDTSAYPTLRHYITVYGEQTEKLLRSYVDVESSGARDQIATARIETIEALQVLEQAAAGELSRAVSAKTLGITADSDAIQRLARMDGYDDVAPSPVLSSAADEGRHAPSQTPSGGPAHQSDQKTDAQ